MKNENNSMNYKIAMAGAFSALSIILSFTPLGYIQLGSAIQITLMHIPVILATLLAGLISGLATGFVFGVSSLVKNLMLGAAASPFFMNPLVSVLPPFSSCCLGNFYFAQFYSAHAQNYKCCFFRRSWNFYSYCSCYGRDFYFLWKHFSPYGSWSN